MAALGRAMELPRLRATGIHMHVGSQVLDPVAYLGALEVALSFLEEARDALGFVADVLDVGGGMAVAYRSERPSRRRTWRARWAGSSSANARRAGWPFRS